MPTLQQINRDIVSCTKCPRLVDYLRQVGNKKRRMYLDWDYWARPVPSFGNPNARLLVLGLAPAAHGGARTGRIFTGDRSGDWLYGAMHQFGFANQATSTDRTDGLLVKDTLISSAIRCAPPDNKPLPEEMDKCRTYLVRELKLLKQLRVVLALGKIAFDSYLMALRDIGVYIPLPRPHFAHKTITPISGGITLIGSYHPSQQNTFTGRLTWPMFEMIFSQIRSILDKS